MVSDGYSKSRQRACRSVSSSNLSLPVTRTSAELTFLRKSYSSADITKDDYNDVVRDAYQAPSWFWRYYREYGAHDDYLKDRYYLGPRFWPTYTRYHRYHVGEPTYGFYRDPRYSRWRYTNAVEPYFWRRQVGNANYYSSLRSWVNPVYRASDYYPNTTYDYSYKMPFYNYAYYTPRTSYTYSY